MTGASGTGHMIEGKDAAKAALQAGRPALLWQRQVADTDTPMSAALKLVEPGRGDWLLESVEGGEVRGRYSLIRRISCISITCRGG